MTDKETNAILMATLPLEQHRQVQVVPGSNVGFEIRRKGVDVLKVYLGRGMITQKQHQAARILQSDFDRAGVGTFRIVNLSALPGAKGGMSEAQWDAYMNWRDAVMTIRQPTARQMVLDVVCYGFSLTDKGKDYGYYSHRNARMPRFLESLDDLVRHYSRKRRIRI